MGLLRCLANVSTRDHPPAFRMSCMGSPDDKANYEEAVLLLWAEYCSVLMPASVSMDFIQRPILAGVTGLYGFNRGNK